MDVIKFRMSNIGRFEELEVPLASHYTHNSNVTVLVGNNGSGKTSILKSLSTSLSWLVAQVKSEKGRGGMIPELFVLNGKSSAAIDIEILDDRGQCNNPDADPIDQLTHWTISKARKGRKGEHKSELAGASDLADYYRSRLTRNEQAPLPLIAFYSVERVVIDIPLKIRGKHSFMQLDGYENALGQGVDFRRFFEWFREREDAENESGLSDEILNKLASTFGTNNDFWSKLQEVNASTRDRQLTAVRTAVSSFLPGFSNLKVKRKPRLHMAIDKNGKTLDVAQLSQGEKSLMALIGDIARRLAMMNPALENPLHGDGIVLIDEVDMHLHPKWQRSLIQQLTNTFPNCQFVLTTHSPLVISDCKDVLTYMITDDGLLELDELYGEDANSVLLDVMDTDIRNAEINVKINDVLDDIQSNYLDKAKTGISELEKVLPARNLELAKAKLLLRKKELRSAKDQ